MTPIETNKPLFFNLDGEPLNGTIYIGQPNTDPRTNPKTVTFRDSGGSEFTASQPLTTINGRISYNGKPIVALVSGEYSLLSFDKFGAQVEYDKSVQGDASASADGFSEIIRVGSTLADIKLFDASVGDALRNLGESVIGDGNGGDWYAISNTGSPGDDENLIDLANGLQARRYGVPYYLETTVTLGGDFNPSTIAKIAKSGSSVTVSSVSGAWEHAVGTSADSDVVVPDWARPEVLVTNVFYLDASVPGVAQLEILPSGVISVKYKTTDVAGFYNVGTTVAIPSVTYNL